MDNYRLGCDINSKVLAFAFGLAASATSSLNALARMKSEGTHVGRPRCAKSKTVKLVGKQEEINRLLAKHTSKIKIAKMMGVHRSTLRRYLQFS
jgi:DNA invertase Pin-like site-specific DNA recombinase